MSFNEYHHILSDSFFLYFTHVGDGLVAVGVTFVLLFIKFRYALLLGLSNILSGLIIQVSKNFIFPDAFRPKKYFDGIHELYYVSGVDNHFVQSFPSGHTGCAFATFFGLALIVKQDWLKFLCFSTAALVGYSRIYLSQHFLIDVYFGSIIAMVVTIYVYFWINTFTSPALEGSIKSLFSKR
ncbi:MAG: phosphatase PAP2 family protein [Saprospiraceae bacterium]|nr:phosphatase PAP2 family protein [Saprospiraceae bacterium]